MSRTIRRYRILQNVSLAQLAAGIPLQPPSSQLEDDPASIPLRENPPLKRVRFDDFPPETAQAVGTNTAPSSKARPAAYGFHESITSRAQIEA